MRGVCGRRRYRKDLVLAWTSRRLIMASLSKLYSQWWPQSSTSLEGESCEMDLLVVALGVFLGLTRTKDRQHHCVIIGVYPSETRIASREFELRNTAVVTNA